MWPIMTCIIGWQRMAKRLDFAVEFDAAHVYLPAARHFLEQGWSYLLTPESYRVVPLAYLWPALWLGETEWIRFANCGLWAICVYFLWSTAKQLGGNRCGAFAMILWTMNPEIYRYFPSELTEPIFLFGLMGWTWAIISLILTPKPRGDMAWMAAIFLCITLLSRPVLQLIAPLGLMLCIGLLIWPRMRDSCIPRIHLQAISISLTLGMLIPLLLLIKNSLVFGLWGLGTGAGTGLYLGTNPLFQGTEPAFLGFEYDTNLLAQITSNTNDHLSLSADRAARTVGIWQLQNMSSGEAFTFLSRKLWWWLAHHPASLQVYGSILRKLRLFEITAVIFAIALMMHVWMRGGIEALARSLPDAKRAPISRMVAAIFILLLFGTLLTQLLPILYNSRYSTALLDPWLVVLAAFSLAVLLAPLELKFSEQSWIFLTTGKSRVAITLMKPLMLVAITSAIFSYAMRHEAVTIDQPAETETLFELPPDRITTVHLTSVGTNRWVMDENVAVLSLDLTPLDLATIEAKAPFNAIWRMNLALTRKMGKCQPSDIAYQLSNDLILNHYTLRLRADGKIHPNYIHGNHALRPTQPGRLRIVFKCPTGTEITWAGTALLKSIHPQLAAQHVQTN